MLSRFSLLALYLLMTIQFVGCYLFLGHPYINLDQFAHGSERLPFQTRLLLSPLFRWAQTSPFMLHYAAELSKNTYFFPKGIGPGGVAELYLDLPCVIIAGWVAVKLYHSASRRQLLGWLVYPLFLVLCAVTFILHAVQNYRFIYDMPSLAFFALGLYLIYFRKSVLLLAALFAVSTLNRETTLLLIPFFVVSACVRNRDHAADDRSLATPRKTPETGDAATARSGILSFISAPASPSVDWKRALAPEVAIPVLLMLAYWTVWHVFIFHTFRNNPSEYYSRWGFNLYCLRRLRYYPQLLSACGYLLPVLVVYRKHIRDAQLRIWLWNIPVWYALMAVWGILVETRVFGELLPFIACSGTLITEEAVVAAMRSRDLRDGADEEDRTALTRVA